MFAALVKRRSMSRLGCGVGLWSVQVVRPSVTSQAMAEAGGEEYRKRVTTQAQQLLQKALRLSTRERAKVAAELLASIDGEADADADAAWAVEIERRARRAKSGESVGRDWAEVRKRLKKSSGRK